ncbi:M16 family metallopeptidase [Frigidibacter sp. ROC022]|uniref:M16 family metallopeptidase n=1 Tax=Frigidibacter sp. ROC022 TaxID=2971796 RepID=UPI00215AC39B|nr:pitrilysin family protein [Frigidibacter sp. ROC022]MCR8724881.1 insulinase family protein [Frigidibacter sp. ROC022]
MIGTLARGLFLALCTLVALPALAAVDIQEVKSEGGITAWLVEEHSIPFVALELRFRGGAALDAPGKRGAINLMTGLIEEGAADMDARAFAEARESLAASFRFDVHDDSMMISAKFLTENRDEAVELLRKALIEPRFDPDAIERVRAQVLSIIKSNASDPGKIASTTFNHLAWGDHPYGTDLNGTPESVAALTRDDLVAAKNRVMARDRLYVGVVGDITAEELGPLLDHLLGALPATGAPMPERATYQLKPGVTVVPWDSPQSIAIFGHEGIKLEDPDYFAAYVLNEAVGGGNFSSRLMDEVREKRGLTYGIGSYLAPMDLGELIVGQFASANGKMAEALDVVRSVWTRVAEEGLTETELADAKTYLTGAYPLRFDGNGTIAGIIVGMQMAGFPIDYAATRNDKIEAVTMEDIKRVAKRLYRPEDLAFVVVGKPEGVESDH